MMANKKNKVKYNLKNVHYALLNIDEAGNVSYGTPVPIPGAVSIGLDANGEPSNFYADGYAYYTISNNMGYEGDLEIAMVPESFRVDVLKEQLDDNKVLVENANVETANFALLFEFDGDIKKIRHVLYKCAASRPSIESQTNEDEIEVQTETLSLKATPLANGFVKNEIYLGTDFYPQLIDDETFAKAQEVRSTNAKSQNRLGLYRPEKQIPKTFCFKIGKVEKKYDDPYLQAQYTYSQIGEDSNE